MRPDFIIKGPQQECFSENVRKIFGRAIFVKQFLIIVSKFTGNSHSSYPLLPHLYMVTWGKWVGGWPIQNITLSTVECDGHITRYGFVGRLDSQSTVMTVKLFLQVHFVY